MLSKGLESSPIPQLESINSSALSLFFSIHDYWKNLLLFNMLSRFVTALLPRSKCLNFMAAVVLESKKLKSVTVSIVPPSICHEVMGPDAMIFVFRMLSFKPVFSLSSFTFCKRLFSSSLLYAIRVVLSAYLRLLIFLLVILIPACATSSLAFHMMYSA